MLLSKREREQQKKKKIRRAQEQTGGRRKGKIVQPVSGNHRDYTTNWREKKDFVRRGGRGVNTARKTGRKDSDWKRDRDGDQRQRSV